MLAVYACCAHNLLGTLNGCVYCVHTVNKMYILCTYCQHSMHTLKDVITNVFCM